jgi:hypothetical protein
MRGTRSAGKDADCRRAYTNGGRVERKNDGATTACSDVESVDASARADREIRSVRAATDGITSKVYVRCAGIGNGDGLRCA